MQTTDTIEIFIVYASEDEKLREDLYRYLTWLQRDKPISFWSTHDIVPGKETAQQIRTHLNAARIVLVLISAYSLASNEIYQQQILPALERAKTEQVTIIPVLLRPINWEFGALGKLSPLPTNREPIVLWKPTEAAWNNVMGGISKAIDQFTPHAPSTQTPSEVSPPPATQPGKVPVPASLSPQFDVFLCYNSQDKNAVKAIGLQLKERGIKPWLDEWELRPGLPWLPALEEQIANINSVAVCVGKGRVDKNGKITPLAPWQQMEVNAALQEFARRGCPVIPVLLQDAPEEPQLPLFLRGMQWVDFRQHDPDPLNQLAWGITGIAHSGTA